MLWKPRNSVARILLIVVAVVFLLAATLEIWAATSQPADLTRATQLSAAIDACRTPKHHFDSCVNFTLSTFDKITALYTGASSLLTLAVAVATVAVSADRADFNPSIAPVGSPWRPLGLVLRRAARAMPFLAIVLLVGTAFSVLPVVHVVSGLTAAITPYLFYVGGFLIIASTLADRVLERWRENAVETLGRASDLVIEHSVFSIRLGSIQISLRRSKAMTAAQRDEGM